MYIDAFICVQYFEYAQLVAALTERTKICEALKQLCMCDSGIRV